MLARQSFVPPVEGGEGFGGLVIILFLFIRLVQQLGQNRWSGFYSFSSAQQAKRKDF